VTATNWPIHRLRDVAELCVSSVDKHCNDDELPVRLCNYVDVYKHDRITEQIAFMPATASKSEIERFRLRVGDVLITKDSETWNDIAVPALVEYEADDLVSGYHLALFRPRNRRLIGPYLLRALQSPEVAHQFHVAASGVTRYGLSHSAIKSVELPVPPLEAQEAIVRFLDHADRRIRRAIRAKQKLIALLNEQKQAVIHRAVTRGLDLNVCLKPSGVDWLGDVPEHWKLAPLKHLVPHVTVGIVVQPAQLYVSDGVPCLRSLNISTGVVKDRPLVFISPQSNQEHAKSRLATGDLVVVRTGRAGIAAVVPSQFNGANCVDLLIVRKSEQLVSEYLQTYLNSWSARTDVAYRSVGAIQAHYNTATLANLIVPAPPKEEQVAILAMLDRQLSPATSAEEAAIREIELLGECRARLIADAVTGRLDVRDVVARLPNDVEEPEPLDEIDVEESEVPDDEEREPVEA
jgi:type I restriction enzyme, S subunit